MDAASPVARRRARRGLRRTTCRRIAMPASSGKRACEPANRRRVEVLHRVLPGMIVMSRESSAVRTAQAAAWRAAADRGRHAEIAGRADPRCRDAEQPGEPVGDGLHRQHRFGPPARITLEQDRRARVRQRPALRAGPRPALRRRRSPRLTPCPASGCTPCAASPTSATRWAIAAGTLTPAAEIPRCGVMHANAPSACRPAAATRSASASGASASELLRELLRRGPDDRHPASRQRQPREDAAVVAEPLVGPTVVRALAGEVGDHRGLRHTAAPRPRSRPPRAPTSGRRRRRRRGAPPPKRRRRSAARPRPARRSATRTRRGAWISTPAARTSGDERVAQARAPRRSRRARARPARTRRS